MRVLLLLLTPLVTNACAARVVTEPGGVDSGSSDASGSNDVDHGDAAYCANDAGLDYGYCLPGYHCELFYGKQYVWNFCCPAGEDGGGHDCQAPSH